MRGGTSGLRTIGTADKPIIFRGIDGSGWTGIGYCESNWSGNNLTYVEVHNAKGPPEAWTACGHPRLRADWWPSILVGYSFEDAFLHVENIKVTGPNNAPADIGVNLPSSFELAGTNVGTGDGGELVIVEF